MKHLFVSVFVLLVLNSFSQTNDSLKSYDLKEIFVTATRSKKLLKKTPEVMHIVTSEDIEQLNVSSTGEILDYLTGVNIETGTGSGFPKRSIVSLDGFPANYSLIMVDGMRLLTEHIHTGQNIDLIPPENIDRIEVIKGAASAQYGSDALGGIVNIITKRASETTESGVLFSVGSYDTYNASVFVRSPVNDKVSISTFSNYEQSAGITLIAPGHRIGNMGYSKFSFINGLNWEIDRNNYAGINLYYIQNSMEFRDDNMYGKMLLTSADYKHKINENILVNTSIKHSHWDAEQSGENHNVFNPELYLSWDKLKNNILITGADYRYITFIRSSVQQRSQNAYGAFIQDELELEKISFLMAIRLDQVTNITAVITPKFAMMYQAHSKVRLRASLGRGFHAPTVQELYEEGYGHGGRAYRFGNPDLQPEYSLTATFSIEYEPVDNIQLLIHGYYNTIDNMITPVYSGIWEENPDTSTVIDKWVRTNIHKAKIYGIETAFRYQLTNKFTLEGGYSYTENENSTTGGQLPYYPGESFYSKIIYTYKLTSKFSGLCFMSLRATRNRSAWNWKPAEGEDFDNTDGLVTELKDYELINAGIKFIYNKKMDIYLNIGNILSQDIQKLDDVFTEIKGELTWKAGCMVNF